MAREVEEAALLRWNKLRVLQKHYASFNRFMDDMMRELGFPATWMQHDIASYMQYGPRNLMIQAQRGEAKSTIAAIFAVWSLIHNPKCRVVIVSAGENTANEIATLVQKLIMQVEILECLRPDKSNGDRTSIEAFDVHYTLKGMDKSPSLACVGIGANLPGKRADLVIADDIESPKNSLTAAMRERLSTLSKEFSAWCSTDWSRIIYLGTPQSTESIYNALPQQGFDLRIWPGRYPTPEELPNYGTHLAPSLVERMTADPSLQTGGGALFDKGKPTDPDLFGEEKLIEKWRIWAESGFQLQYMLNTRLLDALRFPLKWTQAVVLSGCDGKRFPLTVLRGIGPGALKTFTSAGHTFQMSQPHSVSDELTALQGIYMHVDPAGGGVNADETGWAVTGFLNGNVYLLGWGGIPGGYELAQLEELADIAARFKPNTIGIEKNMGHGGFAKVWLPILRKKWQGNIEEEFVHGQKEVRIIGTLEPMLGRGALIVLEEAVAQDNDACEKYAPEKRKLYSGFYQVNKMSKVRKALKHDDRADALEGAVRKWMPQIAIDQEKVVERMKRAEWEKWAKDPLLHNRCLPAAPKRAGSLFNKYRR
jgi:hypothetical protein